MPHIVKDPEPVGIKELLSRKLEVPAYQRFYSWPARLVRGLLEDILLNISSGEKLYLGAVIVKERSKSYRIIDGQQRILTTLILLRALSKSFKAGDNADVIGEIFKPTTISKHNLDLNEGRRAEYFQHVILNGGDPDILKKEVNDAGSEIEDALNVFLEQVSRRRQITLEKIRDFILGDIEFVAIVLDGTADESEVFEAINTKRLELSAADLIKNLLVSRSGVKEREAVEIWNNFYNEIGDAKRFSRFIADFAYATTPKEEQFQEPADLLRYFKGLVKGRSNALAVLKKLERYAAIYKEIAFYGEAKKVLENLQNARTNTEKAIITHLASLSFLGFTSHDPLVLKIAVLSEKGLKGGTALKCLKYIEATQFLSQMVLGRLPQTIKTFYYDIMFNISKQKDLSDALRLLKEKYVEFLPESKRILPSLSATSRGSAKKKFVYMLSRIYGEKNRDSLTYVGANKTWEHILPNTVKGKGKEMKPSPNPHWLGVIRKDLKVLRSIPPEFTAEKDRISYYYARYVNSLGNSGLLTQTDNSKTGNESFAVKKKIFEDKEQNNIVFRYVLKVDRWASEQIEENGQYLAGRYFDIFKI